MTGPSPVRLDDLIGQQRPTAVLRSAIRRGRVAHSYLFWGPELVGKSTAAALFAQSLNCETEESRAEGLACGGCQSCRLIASRNHPDVRFFTPADDSPASVILIEDLREDLVYDVHLKPVIGRHKVYVLDPADRTAHLAIHTVLKILEEPPPYVVIILVTAIPALLPPTIPSRCQQVAFQLVGHQAIERHLLALGVGPAPAAVLARCAEGRIGWAIRAAQNPAVLPARRALLDLCARLDEAGAKGALRVADEIKAQAAVLAQSRVNVRDQGRDDEEAEEPEEPEETSSAEPAPDLRAEVPWCLDVLVSWYRDVLTGPDGDLLNPDYASAFRAPADPQALERAERSIESLLATKRAMQRANIDLALESLSIDLVGGGDR